MNEMFEIKDIALEVRDSSNIYVKMYSGIIVHISATCFLIILRIAELLTIIKSLERTQMTMYNV